MTLANVHVPELWIIGLCLGVMIATFTLFGIVMLAWRDRASEANAAEIYQLHQRMAEIAEPPASQHKTAA